MTALVQSLLKGSASRLTSYVRWVTFNVVVTSVGIVFYLDALNPNPQATFAGWVLMSVVVAVPVTLPIAALTALLAVLFGGLK